MDAERWTRVSEILSKALDLPEPERTRFLTAACRREPELQTDLVDMFGQIRETGDFLETPLLAADGAAAGGGFGSYTVVRELGHGGMGVVYLAERNDGQFSRQVAIKRLGSEAGGADVLRRFRDERQILAGLDHPNIARLFDAGLDASGVPYLVLEHVDGVPITTYCRDRHLQIRGRLALFLQVCAAVHHAHQNLIVHRDIKPNNILVSPNGEPKLLDFGIAKILGDGAGGDLTRTVNRALTLDYASPEQVRGQPTTTASDVYSLGVLLYELLADRRPYDAGEASLTEAVRLVCEEVPPPPSRMAPPDRRGDIAADLDVIVAKAMEKAPADRYGSVAELAADIAAFLNHRPVTARDRSFGYLAGRFVRRHRAATAVATIFLLLAVTGVAAVLWQARVAGRERDRAEQRFQEVRRLATYVIYDLQDGIAKLSGSTELRRSMVARSLAYLDSLVAEGHADPALLMEIAGGYQRLGDVQGNPSVANLGDAAGARASYARAGDAFRRILESDPGNPIVRRRLARLLLLENNLQQQYGRDPERASAALREAQSIWEALVAEEPDDEENLRGLASLHYALSSTEARGAGAPPSHMEKALDIFQRLLDRRPSDTSRMRNVALCHKNLSGWFETTDRARALEHAQRAAEIDRRRVELEPHNATAKLDYSFDLSMLGSWHSLRGNYRTALGYFEQALAIRRELWEADRADVRARDRMAAMLAYVGHTYVQLGQGAEARRSLEEAMSHAEDIQRQAPVGGPRATLAMAYGAMAQLERHSRQRSCAWVAKAAALEIPLSPEVYGDMVKSCGY
jgi:eukaryotic-like serine/threonine-protein kinase